MVLAEHVGKLLPGAWLSGLPVVLFLALIELFWSHLLVFFATDSLVPLFLEFVVLCVPARPQVLI